MAVIQYPYNLEILTKTEGGFNESNGEWTSAVETWTFHAKCRDEANGSGGRVTNQDGQVYIYGSLIHLPKGTDGLKGGDKVRVVDSSGTVRVEGSVQRFSKDQLHARIWL